MQPGPKDQKRADVKGPRTQEGESGWTEQCHRQAMTENPMIPPVKPPAPYDADAVKVRQATSGDDQPGARPTVLLMNTQLGEKK